MEHARQEFARNLVHVRYHQQQALRSRVRGGQRTGLQRAVHRTGSAGFRLHFLYQYRFAEDVLAACGSPFVHIFCHGGRRRDGINSGHFREHIRDMRRGLVAITCQILLFFSHNLFVIIMIVCLLCFFTFHPALASPCPLNTRTPAATAAVRFSPLPARCPPRTPFWGWVWRRAASVRT